MAFGYIDILGFRDSIRREPERIVAAYREAVKHMRLIVGVRIPVREFPAGGSPEQGLDKTLGYTNVYYVAFFSDSVFIFGVDDSQESIRQVSALSNVFFRLFLDRGFPSQGAVAVGEVWCFPTERVFAGAAIVRAHDLADGLAMIGIVLAPDVPAIPNQSDLLDVPAKGGGVVRLAVPLQDTTRGFYPNSGDLIGAWKRLEQAAEAGNNAVVIAKYHGSRQIRDALLSNYNG